jgi:hypothetical protein
MRKLKLELDQLKVETLEMAADNAHWGTVNGRAQAMPTAEETCETGTETQPENCYNEVASFDYPCLTMNMLDQNCVNYTGVTDCYNTKADFCH